MTNGIKRSHSIRSQSLLEDSSHSRKGPKMAEAVHRPISFYCPTSPPAQDEDDFLRRDTDDDRVHSPTDNSEDSVEVKVSPISGRNKRKCAEPRRVQDSTFATGPLKKRMCLQARIEATVENQQNRKPFRPWSAQFDLTGSNNLPECDKLTESSKKCISVKSEPAEESNIKNNFNIEPTGQISDETVRTTTVKTEVSKEILMSLPSSANGLSTTSQMFVFPQAIEPKHVIFPYFRPPSPIKVPSSPVQQHPIALLKRPTENLPRKRSTEPLKIPEVSSPRVVTEASSLRIIPEASSLKLIPETSSLKVIPEASLRRTFADSLKTNESLRVPLHPSIVQHHPLSHNQSLNPVVSQNFSSSVSQNFSAAKTQNFSSSGAQNFSSSGAQNFSSSGSQNFSSSGAQNFSSSGSQNFSSSGSQHFSSSVSQNFNSPVSQSFSPSETDKMIRSSVEAFPRLQSQRKEQRNYKNMTRERRIEANARERTRVHTISAAFDTLRKAIPSYSHSQKLSKLSVLRIACSYIMTLSNMVDNDAEGVAECVESVSRTIQREGKLRKKKDDSD